MTMPPSWSAPAPGHVPEREDRSETILVVDDDESTRLLVEAQLLSAGYRVALASSGLEALDRVRAGGMDFVLLDIDMPELDGFEVLTAMRALRAGANLPIVFLTVASDPDTHARALESDADDFLHKLIEPTALLMRVRSLLRLRCLRQGLEQSERVVRTQRDELAQQSRWREHLRRAVVHNLRSPLGTVLLGLDHLADLVPDSDGTIEDLRLAANRMKTQITDFADVDGSLKGGLQLRGSPSSLGVLLEEVAWRYERTATDLRCRLDVDAPAALPIQRVDEELLRRALCALLENALENAPPDSDVRLFGATTSTSVTLGVSDCGPAVDPEDVAGLFEPWSHPRGASRRARLGLGLPLARLVAEAHGGYATIERTRDGRTSLTLVIPRPAHAQGAPPRRRSGEIRLPAVEDGAPTTRPQRRLMVVEADPTLRLTLGRLLTAHGFAVRTARDLPGALELMEREEFEAVLCDVSDDRGPETLRAIRDRAPVTPVVVSSAIPERFLAATASVTGIAGYLVKPPSRDRLIDCMSNAVRLGGIERARRELGPPALPGGAGGAVQTREALDSALSTLHMVWQPIVVWPGTVVRAWEGLMRTRDPRLPRPTDVLAAAEAQGRLADVGRAVRSAVARSAAHAPDEAEFFVNLHPDDLMDPALFDPRSILGPIADRVVFELTERATLSKDAGTVQSRVDALRRLGYRIAVDDLGAGYSGLSTFVQLRPDVAKLDMVLVRGIEADLVRQRLVRSLSGLCLDLGIELVAEGVETLAELTTLSRLGCTRFQGWLFARPAPDFPAPNPVEASTTTPESPACPD